MPKIRFLPLGIDVSAIEGEICLGQVIARMGFGIDQPCGGLGTCGKCRVIVRGAKSVPSEQEKKMLTNEDIDSGYRLACRCPVEDGLTVVIENDPDGGRSIAPGLEQINRYGKIRDPLVKCVSLCLEMPGLREKVSSISEIATSALELPTGGIPLTLMDPLQKAVSGKNAVKAVFSDRRLVALGAECGFKPYGLAIDIGTTSLVMLLADLEEGIAVDALSDINPQAPFGADILTRLTHIANRKQGLQELRETLLSSLNRMARSLARNNGISSDHICAVSVAGNTCMEHIFAGVDPSSLGKSPFIPPFRFFPRLDAAEAGLEINPLAEVLMALNISGYVGGDITAGIEASGMAIESRVTLFVDIGTNSEIVLGNRDFLVSCSAAAGPAFEGARVSCGMRAARGAIERISIVDDRLSMGVIGGGEPVGICGSGIVDLVAEMLDHGLVGPNGKMCGDPLQGKGILISTNKEGMKQIVLSRDGSGRDGHRVTFTQKDIREVQLAKGAIATGIQALLEKTGLDLEDVDRVVVAGAFGNYLNPGNAAAIGLLPVVPVDKIEYMGNTSIVGAFHALVSRKDFMFMNDIACRTDHLELSTLDGFQARFLANLRLGPASCDR